MLCVLIHSNISHVLLVSVTCREQSWLRYTKFFIHLYDVSQFTFIHSYAYASIGHCSMETTSCVIYRMEESEKANDWFC
jgi:hypothetical protein